MAEGKNSAQVQSTETWPRRLSLSVLKCSGRLRDSSLGWLVGRSVGRSVGRMVGRLAGRPFLRSFGPSLARSVKLHACNLSTYKSEPSIEPVPCSFLHSDRSGLQKPQLDDALPGLIWKRARPFSTSSCFSFESTDRLRCLVMTDRLKTP